MKISVEEKKKLINKQNLSYRFKVNKHKKNFLRSFIKEIKTTGKKIYWKSLFNITYFYKTFNFLLSNTHVTENKISILIPTRERVLKFERFLNSAFL